MRGGSFGGQVVVALALLGDVGERDGLARTRAAHAVALELQLACIARKNACGNGAQTLFELVAGLFHGHARDVGGGRRIRARVIRRCVRVGTEHVDVVHRAFHVLGDHLGEDGVTARAHVGCADGQHVRAVVVEPDGGRSRIDARDAGALHGYGDARSADLAVAHVAYGILGLPVEHFTAMLQAAVKGARVGDLAVVGRHGHALAHDALLAQCNGVHAQRLCQLVYCGLHGKLTLRGAETAVGARGLHVRVDHVGRELVRLQRAGVQGNRLMASESHCGPAMLAIGTGVGERVHVQGADAAVLVGTQANLDLHLVTRRAAGLGLLTREYAQGGTAGLQRDECGIDLGHCGLLRAETAADAWLLHADAALRDAQGMRQDAANVEDDLRGRDHMQTSVAVHLAIRAEGLHHGLVVGLRVIGPFHHDVAVGKHRLDVAAAVVAAGNEVALVVATEVLEHVPVVFGVHQDGVVLGRAEVQNGLEHLVGYLDAFEGFVGGLLVLGGHDGHDVAHIAYVTVDDEAVVRAGLGVGLAGVGKAVAWHILPGIYVNDTRDGLCLRGIDGLHDGVGMGAAQQLYHQRVVHNVLGVDGLAQQQLHRVLFANRLAHGSVLGPIHAGPPLRFCCSGRCECRAAGPRNPSSGRDSRSGTQESRHPWGRGSRAAARWCSSQSPGCRSHTVRRPGRQ